MNVVTCLDIGYPFVGGAQLTHYAFLKALAQRHRHRCTYLDRAERPARRRHPWVNMASFRDWEECRRRLHEAKPDIIIGAMTAIPFTVRWGKLHGCPVVAYLNSYEFAPPSPAETTRWKLGFSKRYLPNDVRKEALKEAAAVFVNSRHLQQRLEARAGLASKVIYPCFDEEQLCIAGKRNPRYVVGVCGHPHKGADIFLEMARAFPEQPFLCVGAVHHAFHPAFAAQPNVTVRPFVPTRAFLREALLLVMPSQWEEPFGRTAVEAMANRIPVLASATGGLREIIGETPLAVRNFRTPSSWCRALGRLLGSANERAAVAAEGERRAKPFLNNDSADRLHRTLSRLGQAPRKPIPLTIGFTGDTHQRTAFSMINLRLKRALVGTKRLRVVSPELPADVQLHHDLSEDFSALSPPVSGDWVVCRTWDFGPYPASWAEKITREVDQLWVYSAWTKRNAIESGVPASRIRVLPPGLDSSCHKPTGERYALGGDPGFVFLFVGAPILRKGVDILLKAYQEAFTRHDHVTLVLKTHRSDLFYRGEALEKAIRQAATRKNGPRVIHIDDYLDDRALASLYRRADVSVFPYRAEGFGIPIVESMACGTPALVPRFGACLDYCRNNNAFFVPSRRIALPVTGDFTFNTLGFREQVDAVHFCEVGVEALARSLRRVRDLPAKTLNKTGQRASALVREHFAWPVVARCAVSALRDAANRKVPVRFRALRQEQLQRYQQQEAAKAMFLERGLADDLPVRGRSHR